MTKKTEITKSQINCVRIISKQIHKKKNGKSTRFWGFFLCYLWVYLFSFSFFKIMFRVIIVTVRYLRNSFTQRNYGTFLFLCCILRTGKMSSVEFWWWHPRTISFQLYIWVCCWRRKEFVRLNDRRPQSGAIKVQCGYDEWCNAVTWWCTTMILTVRRRDLWSSRMWTCIRPTWVPVRRTRTRGSALNRVPSPSCTRTSSPPHPQCSRPREIRKR